MWSGQDGLQAHNLVIQAVKSLNIHLYSMDSSQPTQHPPRTLVRMVEIVFIHQPHDSEIEFRLRNRLVIATSPRYSKQLCLLRQTQVLTSTDRRHS